jgi:hypothetical protein
MAHREVLEEILAEDPNILKEIILHDAKYSDRLVLQTACVNKFKFEESKRQGKDIGWSGAWSLWAERGYALKFAELYSDGIHLKTIYTELMAYQS